MQAKRLLRVVQGIRVLPAAEVPGAGPGAEPVAARASRAARMGWVKRASHLGLPVAELSRLLPEGLPFLHQLCSQVPKGISDLDGGAADGAEEVCVEGE